ncbi:MAG TPA: polysaccharide biosynthesis/export family protein [Terriglobia bacterium]|nr:polysaccharide biosynthesis/export family protein [Terriglobia bacterium]
MARLIIALVFGLGVVLPMSARQTKPAGASSTSAASQVVNVSSAMAADYRISPDDELEIQVLDVPEASGTFRVAADGSLDLPLLSRPVRADGLTLGQVADQISQNLRTSGMVSHAHVNVKVQSSRVHAITIAGAVKKPQVYPIFSRMTLLDAISEAQGLADDAGDTAIITRGPIATRLLAGTVLDHRDPADFRASDASSSTIDLRRLLENGDPTLNVELYPGDRVTVRRAGVVYVVGAVNKAGGFALHEDRGDMTILKAIALADDLKSTAIAKKAIIIRKTPGASGGGREIPVNVRKILYGRAPDQELIANDILFVPDSSSKRALHRAGEAAAEAAALMAYRVP